jgi:hypothetical protein
MSVPRVRAFAVAGDRRHLAQQTYQVSQRWLFIAYKSNGADLDAAVVDGAQTKALRREA